jgi:eukaryotic-like serine/threonine-protein kinase
MERESFGGISGEESAMRHIDPLRAEDPRRIGRYRLTGRLGEGGQGIVYRADQGDGVAVALKVLRPRLLRDAEAHTRLSDEIAMVRRVADFCTARVHELGTDDGRSYVVSEYVDGPSLQELVERDGPLTGGTLARLMVGTASALTAIHRAGVLHRDFTPHNVLIGPDGPRVIDFGIARALDNAATVTSGLVGTPAYAAPELLGGEHHTPAADIFGWANAMTFAATGKPAFGADTVAAVFHRILNDARHRGRPVAVPRGDRALPGQGARRASGGVGHPVPVARPPRRRGRLVRDRAARGRTRPGPPDDRPA